MFQPKKFLFFTRPQFCRLHIGIAQLLSNEYPQTDIQFITLSHRNVLLIRDNGFGVDFLPEIFNRCPYDEAELARFGALIDSELTTANLPGLQQMLLAERFRPEGDKAQNRFIGEHVWAIERYLGPGTVTITSMIDHFLPWLLSSLCRARGGRHFSFIASGLPSGRVLALSSPWEPVRGKMPEPQAASANLEESTQALQLPPEDRMEYMKALQSTKRPSLIRRLSRIIRSQKERIRGSYLVTPLKSRIRLRIRQLIGITGNPRWDIRRNDEITPWNGQYFYIPLQLEPEASILMYSPWLQDQREFVRLLSQAAPYGSLLFVKENPKMAGKRERRFYSYLRSLPGVRLVAPDVDTFNLTQGARCVLAITGTATLEATLAGKSGIAFGRPPFRALLATSDFGGKNGFLLAELSDLLRNPPQIDTLTLRNEWRTWLASTFRGSAVPQSGHADSTPENCHSYSNFIVDALQIDNKSTV